ncbi:hypothetical protein [Microbulbifer discodermiae]|uniref:hypothetical protein n=1 Tax=Microbulbifer sp. 2201CG32-9 TaxID=3232309 RepID=UPI00345C26EE
MADGNNGHWRQLEALWQQQPVALPVPEELRKLVKRQALRLRVFAGLEWCMAALLAVYALYSLGQGMTLSNLAWSLILVGLVAWALRFSIGNRRGIWHPLEESTQAYLALARERLQRKRAAIRFAWILFATELAIFALWQLLAAFGWLDPLFNLFSWRAPLTIGVIAGILGAWSWLTSARIRRETLVFEQIQHNQEE